MDVKGIKELLQSTSLSYPLSTLLCLRIVGSSFICQEVLSKWIITPKVLFSFDTQSELRHAKKILQKSGLEVAIVFVKIAKEKYTFWEDTDHPSFWEEILATKWQSKEWIQEVEEFKYKHQVTGEDPMSPCFVMEWSLKLAKRVFNFTILSFANGQLHKLGPSQGVTIPSSKTRGLPALTLQTFWYLVVTTLIQHLPTYVFPGNLVVERDLKFKWLGLDAVYLWQKVSKAVVQL